MNRPKNLVVIGLGYVGLPLALAFSKEIPTIGFDLDDSRIDELGTGVDRNKEFSNAELTSSKLSLTKESSCISDAEFIVVTVPTPITDSNEPDLRMLKAASELIGNRLRKRGKNLSPAIVVFESTTYPGCTEGFCGPLIENASGLKSGVDFFLAYSPERTNFGDGTHTLETIVKVVSGQNPEVLELVSETYRLVVKAGIHTVKDIKTAEASKLIENIQRDLNIALFNELAVIFDRMNIRSSDVFDAAATKWNFHRYYPGLVGGHCIPVDPYYMTYASSELGYDARVVLAGRDMNERMAEFIANKVSGLIRSIKGDQAKASVLLLGLAFKPNVSDLRNSKVMALADLLLDRNLVVDVYDPFVRHPSPDDIGYRILENPFSSDEEYDAVVLAVSHDIFLNQKNRIVELVNPSGLVADLVSGLDRSEVESFGKTYWSL
jgi:UDP-N-acetyl-D-galactosamine dehydrogenase